MDDLNLRSRLAIAGTAPSLARPVRLLDAVRSDAPFHLFVAGYALLVALIGFAAGAHRKMLPLSFYLGAAQSVPLAVTVVLVATGVWALRAKEPLRVWVGGLGAAAGHAPSALLLVSLSVFMGVFSSGKQMLTDLVPFFADPALAALDRWLFGRDAWELTSAAMPLSLMPWLESIYLGCWGTAAIGATVAALFVPALRRVRRQYVWTFLLTWTLLGNVTAALAMSAGPVFYEQVTGSSHFAGLLDYLAQHSHQAGVQRFLWSAYSGAEDGIAGAGISAFPSMHVSSAVLCALLASRWHRLLRWAGLAYCLIILFGSVQLGWHYLVDGVFSIAATCALWLAVGVALERRS